ncbi:MAG: cupin-like domain-containing protein [Erythrobacter sp.]|uniref:cupin-like domain-containing protein n=1 Tax=Erythrobacter sp. TaxID=1042 RepID=UPI0032ED7AB7
MTFAGTSFSGTPHVGNAIPSPGAMSAPGAGFDPVCDPARLVHTLGEESLLSRAALAETTARLPAAMIERRVHDAADGADFRILPACGDLPKRLAEGGPESEWVMLKGLEQVPEYAALFAQLIEGLPGSILAATGPVRDLKAFVFLSAPHTHTPLHFDAEYNVLFQIEGTKTFTTFPPRDPFVTLAARETYHRSGDNLIAPDAAHETGGMPHALAPGDALYVPYCAPHSVRCGPLASISLSLTWQDDWSRDVAEAVRLGPLLRRCGLAPRDPGLSRRRPRLAALASRMAGRVARIGRIPGYGA